AAMLRIDFRVFGFGAAVNHSRQSVNDFLDALVLGVNHDSCASVERLTFGEERSGPVQRVGMLQEGTRAGSKSGGRAAYDLFRRDPQPDGQRARRQGLEQARVGDPTTAG